MPVNACGSAVPKQQEMPVQECGRFCRNMQIEEWHGDARGMKAGGKMEKNVICFATGNEGKLKEIREILKGLSLEVKSMKELGIDVDVEENGKTFEENAGIKARSIQKLCQLPTLADDSGLEVDYMDKAPGIYSARFLGRDTSYTEKNQYIIDQLKDAKGEERSARFVCAIALALPDGREFVVRDTMEGQIGYEQKGENGFGYDPIFYLPEYQKMSAELPPEEKNRISHRGKALRKMRKKMEELFTAAEKSV